VIIELRRSTAERRGWAGGRIGASAPVSPASSKDHAFNRLIADWVERPIVAKRVPTHNQVSVDDLGGGGTGARLVDEVAELTAALAAGKQWSAPFAPSRVKDCYTRALELSDAGGGSAEVRRSAAVEFLGSAVATLALDGVWQPHAAREAVVEAARAIDMSPGAALLAVFLRAIASTEAAQLPPNMAVELFLWLLAELGPARTISLWTKGPTGRIGFLAGAGEATKTRRIRHAADAVLNGQHGSSPHLHAVAVARWDKPYAALVARTTPAQSARLGAWLREAAAALSPVLERDTLFERNEAREHALVSATERRLLRVAYDVHDGPLQELAALAQDLRLVRDQVSSLVDDGDIGRVEGRFADLEARLAALDGGLRDLVTSVRPTTVVDQPLERVLANEIACFSRVGGIDAALSVEGTICDLTDSQKITLYRLVQESLANVRKHSSATHVDICVRARPSYVEVTVRDNGCGFDAASAVHRSLRDNRLGLAGIGARVRLLGGDVDVHSRLGEGVTIRATLPRWRPPAVAVRAAAYAVTV
jgi:signal transduction histidine kinase